MTGLTKPSRTELHPSMVKSKPQLSLALSNCTTRILMLSNLTSRSHSSVFLSFNPKEMKALILTKSTLTQTLWTEWFIASPKKMAIKMSKKWLMITSKGDTQLKTKCLTFTLSLQGRWRFFRAQIF